MFTGIVEEIGIIKGIYKGDVSCRLTLQGEKIFDDLKLGDSVAVNGVCLTVCSINQNTFDADVMHETLNRSSLGELQAGSRVNMERAMPANGRFGGHIVSGHIDGVGTIASNKKDGIAVSVRVKAEGSILKYMIIKGSIAIDGISLTVTDVGKDYFEVSLIPHTGQCTTLLDKKVGDKVNLEADVIGKYVEKFISSSNNKCGKNGSKITRDFLMSHGF